MQSSKIDGVKYVDGKLTIKFRSGAMQAFDSVPDRAVAGLVKAPAPFAYYKSFIKGRYPCHILMASNDRRMTEQSGMVTVRQHWMQ